MAAHVAVPWEFKTSLEFLIGGMNGLLRSSARQPSDLCFELAASRDRPVEFMQCMLDLIRVLYEPDPPGSLHLNSNWDLVSEAVPSGGFDLAYATVIGAPGQGVASVAADLVPARLLELGYAREIAGATFVCVSAGSALCSRRLQFMREVNEAFDAGWSEASFGAALKLSSSGGDSREAAPTRLAGLALDPLLAPDQVRVSLWMFFNQSGSPPRYLC